MRNFVATLLLIFSLNTWAQQVGQKEMSTEQEGRRAGPEVRNLPRGVHRLQRHHAKTTGNPNGMGGALRDDHPNNIQATHS
jgi:hypothetical protein